MAWPKEVSVKRYPSDITDEEWEILKEALEEIEPYTTGRPRKVDLREVLNASVYPQFIHPQHTRHGWPQRRWQTL